MISPSSTSAIGPPTAASGETWPMEAPLDAPEKRPVCNESNAGTKAHAHNR